MNEFSNEFTEVAAQRLEAASFNSKPLSELYLPSLLVAETTDNKPVIYQIHGDLRTALSVFVDPMEYSVRLSDLPQQVRLAAKQVVLGPDFCVVGVQPYDPKFAKYSKAEREKLKTGSYKPMSDRVLAVIEAMHLNSDQKLILQGDSLGADISIETSFQMLTNPSRGIRAVNKLGATEYVRGKNHSKLFGGIAIMRAFSRSGENLYDDIIASDSVALNEANGIDLTDPNAKKLHQRMVSRGVLKYAMTDVPGTLAGFDGAATDTSTQQINTVTAKGLETMVVRRQDSVICLPTFIDNLTPNDSLTAIVEPGTHSTNNNLRRSSAVALQLACLN